MNITQNLSIALCVLLLSACVANTKNDPMSIDGAIEARSSLDGQVVEIRGFLVIDLLGVPNFMREPGELVGPKQVESIDIIPFDTKIMDRIIALDGKCIVVIGKFEEHKKGLLTFGNLVSKYGDILVKRVHQC